MLMNSTGDLGIGASLGDEGDQFAFAAAELPRSPCGQRFLQVRGGEHDSELGGGDERHGRAGPLGFPQP
jgi:hypothetical protein